MSYNSFHLAIYILLKVHCCDFYNLVSPTVSIRLSGDRPHD